MLSAKMTALTANSSTIRAMFEEGKRLAARYGEENVFDFSIGNPSAQPPEEIRRAIQEILEEEPPLMVHGYMNNSGYPEVREAIARHLEALHPGCGLTGDAIVMTCGAAGGLNILLKTLLNPGDEVVVLAPCFGEYANYVANFDGRLVVVPTDPATFQPDLDRLEAALSPRTKALLLNTPNNPTGVLYPRETLRQMARLLRQKEEEFGQPIYAVSDEPYRELVYGGEEVPFVLEWFENGIVGYSYSKSLSLPGERIGYLAVNPRAAEFEGLMASLNVANRVLGFVNAPSLFQRVIARTLGVTVDVEGYRQNRDLIYRHLTGLGFECVEPQGAFYLFPKCPTPDDRAFVESAKRHNLLLVPGSSFYGPGHFRLSYCVSREKLERSLPAFTQLAREWGL